MASFSGINRVHSALAVGGLVLSQLSGCYAHDTSDEDLLDLPSTAEDADSVSADAGRHAADASAVVVDAGSATPKCAGSDPISLLFCSLTPPASSPATTPAAAVPDIAGLLNSFGGLGNIASVLGTQLGTNTTTPAATQQSPLVGLINLAGGLGNIATLLNTVLGQGTRQPAQPSLADLFAGFARPQQPAATPATNQPSLRDILAGFGIPSAPSPAVMTEPTTNECTNPTNQVTRFVCALQAANQR